MTEVSIVIVSMNRMDLLRPALDSIMLHTTVSYEIFVVAYMFSKQNLEALRTEYPEVKVIVSDELRGFAENNNLALCQVNGRYCFIVNDDAYMQTPVIDALVADMHKLEAGAVPFPAAVQPKIVFPDGRVQTCGRRKMNGWTYLRHYLHLSQELKLTRWTREEGLFRTYNLNGAAFLIRTDIFREVGWFDETYTFTPEDLALGTYLSVKGFGVYCDADVCITHIANSTASAMEAAIKPTRVRGALIFYSSMSKGRICSPQGTDNVNVAIYLLLGCAVWLFEALRGIKYIFADTSDPNSYASVMASTARNVRRNIFTHRLPKEIFVELYNGLKR